MITVIFILCYYVKGNIEDRKQLQENKKLHLLNKIYNDIILLMDNKG